MTFIESPPLAKPMIRQLLIAGGVVVGHAAALWALQAGLLQRTQDPITPPEIVIEWIAPAATPASVPALKPVAAPTRPPPTLPAPTRAPKPARTSAPMPLAVADPSPAPQAPTGVLEAPVNSAPLSGAVPAATSASTTAVAAAPAPARVELPSSDADYLQNPKPPYPALSKRLGEQGKVVVRVLIGVDGQAQQTELKQSSGFDRLDQAALGTVKRWRYVPGKRAGVPEAMWFNVPIHFVLD